MDGDLPPDVATALDRLALLAEPVRRRLFLYVLGADRPVSRDEAASAVAVGRPLAAFHLDRLTAAGLLAADYRRPPGRRGGPGAGRPAKYYRPTGEELEVALPVRRYRLVAEIFAAALEGVAGEGWSTTPVAQSARAAGRRLAEMLAVGATGDRPDLRTALARLGYRPRQDGTGRIWLANCPFEALVAGYQELTCGTNEALLEGVVEGWGGRPYRLRLEPSPGRCCVVLEPGAADGGEAMGAAPEGSGPRR